jgi:hypothetical protein
MALGAMGLGFCPAHAAQLSLAAPATSTQSSDLTGGTTSIRALDGNTGSYSATLDASNSFWEVELPRTYWMTRIEVVAPSAVTLSNVCSGLTFTLHDLRDRLTFTSTVTNPGLGGTWGIDLPPGTRGRMLRFDLSQAQTNGNGTRAVVLAEVRAYGDPASAGGPVPAATSGVATQSTTSAGGAHLAVDGSPFTYSLTATNTPNAFWLFTLDRPRALHRVELINRHDTAAARLQGLTLRVLDDASNTVASALVTNPGLGATWGYTLPAGSTGRFVRIGLEGGATNGLGDFSVQLAEVSLLTASNVALGREAYMVRLTDTLPSPTNANDGNYATETYTTDKTVDAYWEVDLGANYAVHGVRAVCGNGFAYRVSHCTVRLFDENHSSVFAQHHLTNTVGTFDTDTGGPRRARYVRVGLENKERTHISGGIEWYLNFKEIMVYGQPADEVGLLAFAASASNVAAGGSATLTWQERDLHRLDLFPAGGSVGMDTSAAGAGARVVSPTSSVEYVLVGSNINGSVARAVTVTVDSAPLPLRITELMADNNLTVKDGRGQAEDWIEIHNPNNGPVNLGGYGLSDDPLLPMKWVFPATNLAGHAHLLVFASGQAESIDEGGYLHANFSLAADGESVQLTATDGVTVVDALLNYPAQRTDLAYGRTLAGAATFMEPTPGAWNLTTTYTGWLASLDFSHPRGFYTNAISLVISNPNPGATVWYALNGPAPATAYAGPLLLGSSVVVRAEVRQAGYKAPFIQTRSYLFREQIPTAPYMLNPSLALDARYTNRIRQGLLDLPVFSVAVPVLPDDYVERAGSVELFLPDGSKVQANCGIHRFGGAWTTFAKKNYRLQFRREYGDDKLRAPLLQGFDRGFLVEDAFDSLDLLGGSHDMIDRGFYMSSRFVEDAMLDMGSLNPHGRFVNLFINGVYWGQYNLRERLVDVFLADYLGGATTNYVTVRGNDNVASDNFIPGTPEPPLRYPWDRARALRTSYEAVKPYVDVPHLTDFMLLWWYGNCESEYRAAGSVEAGSGFKFWIADADGFLRTSALTLNYTQSSGPGNLFGGLTNEMHVDFKTLVADRIQKHFFGSGALTPSQNLARLNARMAEITNSLVTECARWNVRTPDTWESAANTVRTGLFPNRTTNLFGYLRARGLYPAIDPPILNQYGGSVTNGFILNLTSSVGIVYYTVDGSDPRLPGGGISPATFSTSSVGQSLIMTNSSWRYWDRGSLPATNWNQLAYSDTGWSLGGAKFGFGDAGMVTTQSFGGNPSAKYSAYYYRQPFVVSQAASITQLLFSVLRDDGVAVYLNGQQVIRSNLPTGTLAYATLASAAVGGTDETTFFPFTVPPTALQEGTNVVAVEVHQSALNSSDLSFALALQSQGEAAPLALTLQNPVTILARVLVGTNWSALIEAPFQLAQQKPAQGGEIVISEIHYEPSDSEDYQFIELYNAGTGLVNLAGARLAGGVDFLFPAATYLAPGACVLVVENAVAFSNRYRTAGSPWYYPGLAVAGTWAGKLSDDGEAVSLLATNLADLFSVTYEAGGEWPSRAAGKGSSLELVAPAAVPTNGPARAALLAQGATWRSSSLNHGSPGRLDTYERPVVINEALSHTDLDTDWIELFNPNSTTSILTGLYLGDSYANPLRYAFTNGTQVAPGGYLVRQAAQLGFGFSELGSDILLTLASGTNVIRFVDTVDVSAMEREETAGRYTRSDGEVDFTELRALSKGATNALPRVGPVVFTEIMYHPAVGLAEYIELQNISGAPLPFYDPLHPTNRWALAGAVTYLFPTGLVVAPCQPILICSVAPAAFRAQYGLDTNTLVFGPWSGALNNAGESVKLERPGDPEPDLSVPRYRVDRVRYAPGAPWPPEADTDGISLERITLEAYGNDPLHWQASAPGGSPGVVVGNRLPTVGVAGSLTVNEGEPVEFTVLADDADQPWQTVGLTHGPLPPGATFTATNGLFTWTPAELDGPGTQVVEFVATDSGACGGGIRTQQVAITVAEVNQPPLWSGLGDLILPAEAGIQRLLAASDPDQPAQTLSFSALGLPAGLTLHPASGWLTGAALVPGTYGVSVSVQDDQNPPGTATGAFAVVVSAPFVFHTTAATESGQSISFETLSNAAYRIEFTDTLYPPAWQLLEEVNDAPGGWLQVMDPAAGSLTQRFYRVLWLDPGI